MTSAASSPSSNPFDFAPHPSQDAEFLAALNFVPGLKELLMLRQVHALEHATVWVLSDLANAGSRQPSDNEELGGMSTEQGFYLYGNVNTAQLRRAVHLALTRITSGEWNLAVHPRCGTNLSVGMLLTAGMALGLTLLLPKDPLGQLLGLGVATVAAVQLTPDLGSVAQKYVTTAIPFNLTITEITPTRDLWNRPAHFVRVQWREN